MVSGIKPTGRLHLGNYIGAISQFIKYQEEYELFIFIANLHAITVPIEAKELRKNTKLIAVTILTSISQEVLENELLIKEPLNEVVRKYANNAKEAGLQGVVCSALEAPIIKEMGLISVTPGIRFQDDSVNDQKRVATPAYAKELGSTYIVVGRSITQAEDPVKAYNRCVKEFC